MNNAFRKFAQKCSVITGSPWAFTIAVTAIIVWAVLGPKFKYSDTWQLIINTSTTIITFLMVFLIQNTQNRDSKALHLKIDELIRANKHARNMMINLEQVSDEDLDKLHKDLCKVKDETSEKIEKLKSHRQSRHAKNKTRSNGP
jgi:low affinity Fe/Cu permease